MARDKEREINTAGFKIYKVGLRDILRSSLHFDGSVIPLPRTRDLEEWRTFLEETSQHVDLLQLPLQYPDYSASYITVNRRTARAILLKDFEEVDMFRGEKEFFAAFQGSVIFRQGDREEWEQARRAISPHFSPRDTSTHNERISQAVSETASDLIKDVAEKSVPTSKIFRRFVAQTLFYVYLGDRIPQENIDKLVDSFQAFYKTAPFIVLGLDRFRPIYESTHNKLEPYNEVIEQAIANALIESSPGLMIDFLKQDTENATDWFHTVFAGQSSLATSLEWITYHLATNTEEQEFLRNAIYTPEYSARVGEFLEETADKFPTPTFLLRETKNPLQTTTSELPKHSMIVIPLFGLSREPTGTSQNGIPTDGIYDLQFSPGMRRCLGRYLSESIHRAYITFLLGNTSHISCLNSPTPIIGMTVFRPDEEFRFVF